MPCSIALADCLAHRSVPQDILLPAWKREAYEAAGEEDGENALPPELVKVDEIRLD